jgi:hypothetical protein
MVFSPSPEVRGKLMLGGGLLREERLLSRTRLCVDRVEAFDDLSERVFSHLSQLRYDKSRKGA